MNKPNRTIKDRLFSRWCRKRPRCYYAICTIQRTGSTLLCDAIRLTGVAGRPNEFFAKGWITSSYHVKHVLSRRILVYDRLGLKIPTSAVRAHVQGTFRNGTDGSGFYGCKVHWDQMERMQKPSLHDLFPDFRCVYLTRRDVVRQAISLTRMRQTRQWSADVRSRKSAQYCFNAILDAHAMIVRHQAEWEGYFEDHAIQPYRIVYEDFVATYEETLKSTLNFLGVPNAHSVAIAPPPLKKQADSMTEEWLDRYREDLTSHGFAPTVDEEAARKAA